MRQATILAGAAVALLCVCLVILWSAPALRSTTPELVEGAARNGTEQGEPESVSPRKEPGGSASLPAAPQDTPAADGQDEAARETADPAPSSPAETALAQPSAPAPTAEWRSTVLPRPVASAAGLIEAGGYRIALAGVEPIDPAETCSHAGSSWPCGVGARTAFRAFLRGRSVDCVVPPEPGEAPIAANCSIGTQDVAEWLIENGWARAAPGSDYVALGETAVEAGKGVFGSPPSSAAPAPVLLDSALPRPPTVDGSILATPPSDGGLPGGAPLQPAPLPTRPPGAFPMPPAPPPGPVQ
jgi:endonuclease YncB( thermonuclease family)